MVPPTIRRVASVEPRAGGASSAAAPDGESVAEGWSVSAGVGVGVVDRAEPVAVGVGDALGDCVGVGPSSSVGGAVG